MVSEGEQYSERHDGQRGVLLARQYQDDAQRVPTPSTAVGEPVGEQESRDREILRVKGPPGHPFRGRIEQPRQRNPEREPRAGESIPSQQPQRDSRTGEGERLDQVEEMRASAEPVERHQ